MCKVSVIIPAYNAERHVRAAVASVLGQTHRDLELLVVDDGSTDATVARVRAVDDPRLLLIEQQHRGRAAACNTGIRMASGELLAFLDASDLWEPEKLERHVEHLRDRPTVGVSYSAAAYVDEGGAALGLYQFPKLFGITAQDILLSNPIGSASAPVVRAATMRDIAYRPGADADADIRYFDERFRPTAEVECWTRIALTTNWAFEGIGLPLTRLRVYAESARALGASGAIRSNR